MCPTRSPNQQGTASSSQTHEGLIMSQHAVGSSANGLRDDNVVPDVFHGQAVSSAPTNAAQVRNVKLVISIPSVKWRLYPRCV